MTWLLIILVGTFIIWTLARPGGRSRPPEGLGTDDEDDAETYFASEGEMFDDDMNEGG